MKTCSKCKQELPLSEFNKKSGRKDGLQTFCRECNRARSRKYYAENRDKHIIVINNNKKKYRQEAQEYVMSVLSKSSCTDCGESNVLVLEFDHVHGEKRNDISNMLSSVCSVKTISEEIAKCEILCRNCHAIRTHQRANTFRWRFAVAHNLC